jgi:hypothetical protein
MMRRIAAPVLAALVCGSLVAGAGAAPAAAALRSAADGAHASSVPDAAPAAPTNVVATAGNGTATVTWDPVNTDGISPVTAYTVNSVVGSNSVTVGGDRTSAVVTGLTNGAFNAFTVTATNAAGTSPASAPSNFVTPHPVAPGAPTGLQAEAGNEEVTLTWDAPADDGGSPILQYQLKYGNRALVVGPTVRRKAISGLTNGTTYAFQINAVNAQGIGPPSDAVSATPHGVPGPPGAVHAVAGKTGATVTWTAPADDGGSPITGYLVTANPGGPHRAVPAGTTSLQVTLDPGRYTFTLVAKNAIGLGARATSNAFDIAGVRPAAHHDAGYWMLDAGGTIYGFGKASKYTTFSTAPNAAAVAISPRPDGSGYWVVFADGTVRAYGSARWFGDAPALPAGEQVTTISGTPSGEGYWLFTNRGRAIACGSAHSYGDMRAVPLNGPIVASVSTPTGHGYYLVGSDGGIFTFGDARFHGSTGNLRLNKPVVGIAPTPDNKGYWLVASDGGVFAFDAPFKGSMGGTRLNEPVNGLVAFGDGYLMVASDGGVFDFSHTPFLGSLASHPPASPIVGIAAFAT